MGLNLNLDLNKLPHFWQTMLAMTFGGVFIAGSAIFITSKLSEDREQNYQIQLETNHTVESVKSAVETLESTQQKILQSQGSQRLLIENFRAELKSDIDKVDGRLIYYINHQGEMTAEQILGAFDIGYENGFSDGKKKEMIP